MGAFHEVLEINSHDKAAQLYLERCGHLASNPPPDDWNGVWVMESK
jgi:adenylate cyclase